MQITITIKQALDDALARGVTILGLGAIALIHLLQVPDAFGEIGYLGALFIAAAVACVLLAAALTRSSDDRVWMCAGGLAALIFIGYLLSRSVGLPAGPVTSASGTRCAGSPRWSSSRSCSA